VPSELPGGRRKPLVLSKKKDGKRPGHPEPERKWETWPKRLVASKKTPERVKHRYPQMCEPARASAGVRPQRYSKAARDRATAFESRRVTRLVTKERADRQILKKTKKTFKMKDEAVAAAGKQKQHKKRIISTQATEAVPEDVQAARDKLKSQRGTEKKKKKVGAAVATTLACSLLLGVVSWYYITTPPDPVAHAMVTAFGPDQNTPVFFEMRHQLSRHESKPATETFPPIADQILNLAEVVSYLLKEVNECAGSMFYFLSADGADTEVSLPCISGEFMNGMVRGKDKLISLMSMVVPFAATWFPIFFTAVFGLLLCSISNYVGFIPTKHFSLTVFQESLGFITNTLSVMTNIFLSFPMV
jgi:hypothetical protein